MQQSANSFQTTPNLSVAIQPVAERGEFEAQDDFALGRYIAHWRPTIRHDLSASECATLRVHDLLDMAGDEDRARWESLGLGYTDPDGASWLREAIAERHRGIRAKNVLCCAGAQEALTCVTQALLTPGSHAIVVVPIYQPTEWAVTSRCAATAVALERGSRGWRLDPERVAAAIRPETKLLLINFPNSPTGASIDANELGTLIALCRHHGIWLVNDEVYRLTDSNPTEPPRVSDLYERGISIDAVSKGLGLPGLRVGWIVCQDRLLLALAARVKAMLSTCASAPSEVLAHIALRAQDRIISRNRAVGLSRLKHLWQVLGDHPDLFEVPSNDNLAFAFALFRGSEGAGAFAAMLAREAAILVLHSGLWPSSLAATPADWLRIGMGGTSVRVDAALAAMAVACRRRSEGAVSVRRCRADNP